MIFNRKKMSINKVLCNDKNNIFLKIFIRKVIKYILVILIESVIIIFFVNRIKVISIANSEKQINNIIIYSKIENDLKTFPIPLAYRSEINYEDTFGASRNNGGHEGCDIMDNLNVSGRIPIVSATDGTVTNIGWLYLGGYRIGITSENDIYYYYAHLDSYAKGIKTGDKIIAGQLIGFMGDTGEGDEGTRGKFPVHLHFGIYSGISQGKERPIDPYSFIKMIELK